MTHLELLTCERFASDFLDFCYIEDICLQAFNEEDFEFPQEELDEKIIEFFKLKFYTKVITIYNHPVSYEFKYENETYEFFELLEAFVDLIEKHYGHFFK